MKNTIEKLAISYEEKALYWFEKWCENGEQDHDMYFMFWREAAAKADAMLELLNITESAYNHYVVGNKIVKELIP